MIVLRPTLLPDPVEPATSRCGILDSEVTKTSPSCVRPIAIVSGSFGRRKLSCSSSGRSAISSRRRFGTSIPTVGRPGIRSIRTLSASSASARSSQSDVIRASLIPALGRNS